MDFSWAEFGASVPFSAPLVLTNLADFGCESPSMMLIARLRCRFRVCSSRIALLRRYCHTARHASGNDSASQTGSDLVVVRCGSSRFWPRGVIVSMTVWSSAHSPFQWKYVARSCGALTCLEPTMNRRPASSSSFKFFDESIPASAATTMSDTWWRSWKRLITGMIVWVSALLPSKHPISNGNPVRSTRSPVRQRSVGRLDVLWSIRLFADCLLSLPRSTG